MTLHITIRPTNKEFDEDVNRVKELGEFTQDAIDNGAEQAFIHKLTNACTGAAEKATNAAFFAGEAALVPTGVGVLADALLVLEGAVIAKAVGKASEQLCEDAATVFVKGVEQGFADLDSAIQNISSRITAPNDQAVADFKSMLTSAEMGHVQAASYFATQLNSDFGLDNLFQMPSGNYLLVQNGENEVLTPNFQPVQLFANNSDGSSDVIEFGSLGGYKDTHYSGSNATGNIASIEVEKGNDTSSITTYDSAGNPIVTNYSGPNGTGNIVVGAISISPNDPTVSESAGSEQFTLTRAGSTSQAATVYVSTTDGSTVAGESANAGNFTPFVYQPVTFAPGSSTAQVGVTINDLGLYDGSTNNYGIQVTGDRSPNNILATGQFSIVNNDPSTAVFQYVGQPFAALTGGSFTGEAVDINVKVDDYTPGYTGQIYSEQGQSGPYVTASTISIGGLTEDATARTTFHVTDGKVDQWEVIGGNATTPEVVFSFSDMDPRDGVGSPNDYGGQYGHSAGGQEGIWTMVSNHR